MDAEDWKGATSLSVVSCSPAISRSSDYIGPVQRTDRNVAISSKTKHATLSTLDLQHNDMFSTFAVGQIARDHLQLNVERGLTAVVITV